MDATHKTIKPILHLQYFITEGMSGEERAVVPDINLNIKVPNSFNLMFKCFDSIQEMSMQCYFFTLSQVIKILSHFRNKQKKDS